MEDVCDSNALISAIKSQELLWNYKLKEHSDKIKRSNAWEIICDQVIDNFNEKTVQEKNQISMLVQKKWKILRDGYTRYTKKINPKSGSAGLNPRPYAHYQKMSFLKSIIEDKLDKTDSLQESELAEVTSDDRQKKRNKRKLTITDEDVLIAKLSKRFDEKSQNSRIANEDEDKLFLLSLVGEFKKINKQYKVDARTEILNIMKNLKGMASNNYPSSLNDYLQLGYNTVPCTSTPDDHSQFDESSSVMSDDDSVVVEAACETNSMCDILHVISEGNSNENCAVVTSVSNEDEVTLEKTRKVETSRNDASITKATRPLSEEDIDIFGKYIASEMRSLSSEYLRKKMKRRIQEVILRINQEDEELSCFGSNSHSGATVSRNFNWPENTLQNTNSQRDPLETDIKTEIM